MNVFVDTSALLAVLDADDENHAKAADAWRRLLTEEAVLLCTNYVLVETLAIIQHRLGIEAVRLFCEDVAPVVIVEWVDESLHAGAMAALLAVGRRRLSLVDCVSFHAMRQLGIKSAFVFDRDFADQGFDCIP